jgi:hypothetical protein
MAEMDDVLAELRHRIMGQLKPAQAQHQETPAMTVQLMVKTGLPPLLLVWQTRRHAVGPARHAARALRISGRHQ